MAKAMLFKESVLGSKLLRIGGNTTHFFASFNLNHVKWLVLSVVVSIHLLTIWAIAFFVETDILATPPQVNAINVRFIATAKAPDPSPQAGQQASASGVVQPHKQTERKQVAPTEAVVKIQPRRLTSKNSPLETHLQQATLQQAVQEKPVQDQIQQNQNQTQLQSSNTTQNPAVNQKSDQQNANHQSQHNSASTLNSSQGGERNADEKHQSKAVESAVDRTEPLQVNRVEVLRMGELNYNDRELLNQPRSVVLTITIDPKGQPIAVKIKQSTGITSLDERARQAALKSKFKPHMLNGTAVAIIVHFPIQMKMGRGR